MLLPEVPFFPLIYFCLNLLGAPLNWSNLTSLRALYITQVKVIKVFTQCYDQ